MRHLVLFASAALLVGACGGSQPAQPSSASAAAAEARSAPAKVEPSASPASTPPGAAPDSARGGQNEFVVRGLEEKQYDKQRADQAGRQAVTYGFRVVP